MAISIGKIVVGMVRTNCYFLYNEEEKNAIIVDPGSAGKEIYEKLTEAGIKVGAIILTHGHFDHIMGVNELKEKSSALVYALEAEAELLGDPALNCSNDVRSPYITKADVLLKDEEEVELCGMKFRVLATPGHTGGSCCYYFFEDNILISGDTLFEGSVGRTDLPTGSEKKLIESITKKLVPLDDKVKVYPGHGNYTLIGDEKMSNPFM